MDVTLILTHYNDGKYLGPCLQKIQEIYSRSHYSAKVIIIDDRSDDGSRRVGEKLAAGNPNVTFVYHEHRIGRGASVAEGIRMAETELAGYIDVDLEIPVYALYPLSLALENGADVATAERVYLLYWSSLFRWILSKGYLVFSKWMTGSGVRDPETGCKMFRRQAILPVLDQVLSKHWFWDTETMVLSELAGLKIVEIPIAIRRLKDRVSTVKVWKTVQEHFVDMMRLRRRLRGRARS